MFGTATRPGATRALLLGSGELGKEVAIELQRFGIEVIAADRYADAPAMQVAHRAHVLDMLDGAALRELRQTLPAAVTVWAGGSCPALDRQGVVAGVLRLHALERLPEQVALWRAAAAPA